MFKLLLLISFSFSLLVKANVDHSQNHRSQMTMTQIISKLPSPMLWHTTKFDLGEQIIHHTINFTIQSPCKEFVELLLLRFKNLSLNTDGDDDFNQTRITVKHYEIICENIYNQLIVDQINSNCPIQSDDNHSKRSTQNIASIFSTLGFFTHEFMHQFDTSKRLDELQLNNQDLWNDFKKSRKISNDIHSELLKQIISLMNISNNLSYQIHKHNLLQQTSSTIFNNIIAKLYQIDMNLKNFFDTLKQNKISENFDYLFPNLTLCNLNRDCPRKYWIGHGCTRINQTENYDHYHNMILKLSTIVLSSSYKIIEIDPFIVTKSLNRTFYCFYNYSIDNKKLFFYNFNDNCIKDKIIDRKLFVENPIIFNENDIERIQCINNEKFFEKYWQKSYCKNINEINPKEIIQIKNDNHYNYIYCFNFNLTIIFNDINNESISLKCENSIYQLKIDQSFIIENISTHYHHHHHHHIDYKHQDVKLNLIELNKNNTATILKNDANNIEFIREQYNKTNEKNQHNSIEIKNSIKKENDLIQDIEYKPKNQSINLLSSRIISTLFFILLLSIWIATILLCCYCPCLNFCCCRHSQRSHNR